MTTILPCFWRAQFLINAIRSFIQTVNFFASTDIKFFPRDQAMKDLNGTSHFNASATSTFKESRSDDYSMDKDGDEDTFMSHSPRSEIRFRITWNRERCMCLFTILIVLLLNEMTTPHTIHSRLPLDSKHESKGDKPMRQLRNGNRLLTGTGVVITGFGRNNQIWLTSFSSSFDHDRFSNTPPCPSSDYEDRRWG